MTIKDLLRQAVLEACGEMTLSQASSLVRGIAFQMDIILEREELKLKLTSRIKPSRKDDPMESTGFLKGGSLR